MSLLLALLALAADQYDRPTVSEPELAEQRGGFRLPGGIDVALTVDTTTAVDGAVLLRTIFRADQGAPTLAIYVPKAGEVVGLPAGRAGDAAATANGTTVSYDARNGIQVTTGAGMPAVSIGGGAVSEAVSDKLTAVAAGAVTAAGAISEVVQDGLRRVTLNGADIAITHLAGTAIGAAVANTGSDRAIDTQTTIGIDLANAGPDVVGSAMLRVQDVAADALRGRF